MPSMRRAFERLMLWCGREPRTLLTGSKIYVAGL